MLSPRQSSTRERTSLDGLWRFALDPHSAGRSERWWTGLPGNAEMPVPASFNDVVPSREARDHVGDVWYQRMVRVPRGWDGQRIVLRFDGATHRATVWVGARARRQRPLRRPAAQPLLRLVRAHGGPRDRRARARG